MRRALRGQLTASVLAVALSTSSAARADETNVVAAETLFNEGRALRDKGRFEEACERFSRSQQLDPAVGTLLNLGECLEKLDKIASAWGAYRQAIVLAVTRKDERRASLARRGADRIEPRLARLTITVDGSIPGLTVKRNGARVEAAAYDTPVPVDAGPQVIAATAPDRQPWQTTVELRSGGNESVRIPTLEPTSPPPIAPPPPAHEPSSGNTQRTVALGFGIGGGVVLAGGVVFGGLAFARWSAVDETCPNGRCPTEADRRRHTSDVATARTFATISNVAVGVGAAAIVAGVVLHLTAPERRVSVIPLVDRSAVGIVATLGL
jgi:hypothetical protein